MTIQNVLRKYYNLETELLLAHVLRKPKEFVFLHPEYELTRNQLARLKRLVKRRKRGEPVAYLRGFKEFYGRKFHVNKDVLIPRPETETLVEKILEFLKNPSLQTARYTLLDLGTGSGCIAVTLAAQLRDRRGQIVAGDISAKALRVAQKNARSQGMKVRFRLSDLFEKIPGRFDCIVANLPYVRAKDFRTRYKALKFEPQRALTDGGDTWKLFERFFLQLPAHAAPGCRIFLEIDPASRGTLRRLAARYLPRWRVEFFKDYGGRWRFAVLSA